MSDVVDRKAQQEFATALARFQAAIPHVGKDLTATVKSDKGNYTYDYADLSVIQTIALPLLAAEGLSFSAKPTLSDGTFVLRYTLRHSGGHEDSGDYPLPDPAKSSPQQIGSAITYGRRYAFCAVTGVAPSGEDDDGKTAADSRARNVDPFENARPAVRTKPGNPATAELMAGIKAAREALGMSSDDVALEFAAANEGLQITAASVTDLSRFLSELNARSATQ